MRYIATVDGSDYVVAVEGSGSAEVDGEHLPVDLRSIDGANLYSLLVDNESHEIFVERREGAYLVMIEGDLFRVDVEDERLKLLKAMGGETHEETLGAVISAPMPGLVVKVLVEVGEAVEANQGVAILEAMKMENEIRSATAGTVKSVTAVAGQTVNQGDVLLSIGREP